MNEYRQVQFLCITMQTCQHVIDVYFPQHYATILDNQGDVSVNVNIDYCYNYYYYFATLILENEPLIGMQPISV